jgi:putative hydrolase of the HAD superfamily
MRVEAVFFDVDYTLYDMGQYVRGALLTVAQDVARACSGNCETLFASLWWRWREVGSEYGHLFDDWLHSHGLFAESRLRACVDVYHAHQPTLSLYPGADELLIDLRSRYRVGVITDGNLQMQRSKVDALDLEGKVDLIVYSAALSLSKPDAGIFRHSLRLAGVAPERSVYVGDHPTRDIAGARRAGMLGVRVLTGEFRHLPDDPGLRPVYRLDDLWHLPEVLAELEGLDGGNAARNETGIPPALPDRREDGDTGSRDGRRPRD